MRVWTYLAELLDNLIDWFNGEEEKAVIYIVFGPINRSENDGIHGVFFSEKSARKLVDKLNKTGASEPIYISGPLTVIDS